MRHFAKENGCEERWETIVMRPSGVLKKDRFRFLNLTIADTIGFISEQTFSPGCIIAMELTVVTV